MGRPRVLVVGLDCLAPEFAFERYKDRMPNLHALMARGAWGRLRSVMPPITVPAWACMTSGRDPGELGVYGFRDRVRGRYDLSLVDSRSIRAKRIWHHLADTGRTSSVLFVPPSFPPDTSPHVTSVGCFLTPDAESAWAHPAELKRELEALFGPYLVDVHDVRNDDKHSVLRDLTRMTRQHFAMARHVWTTRDPDFLMMVEIGSDRLHHAMWNAMDPTHPRATHDDSLVEGARAYYALLDEELGAFVKLVDDDTTVMVASDHGARTMLGGVCINEWLIANGWLTLKEAPTSVTPLRPSMVDWSRTRAWGEGGYYARIFLNVRGREPEGVIESNEVERAKADLRNQLAAMKGPTGAPLHNMITDPVTAYRAANGFPPDLAVCFNNLAYRSIGSVGHGRIFVDDNDQGEDGCNHDWNGVFAMAGRGVARLGELDNLSLFDVTPTVLALFDIAADAALLGHNLLTRTTST